MLLNSVPQKSQYQVAYEAMGSMGDLVLPFLVRRGLILARALIRRLLTWNQ